MDYDLEICTAIALTGAEEARIIDKLHRRHAFTTWRFLVDPSLLGGVKLVFKDRIVDNTLKNQLERVHAHLTDGLAR